MCNLIKTFVLLLICSATTFAQRPDGPYRLTAATYGDKPVSQQRLSDEKIIKIFRDGYWLAAFFGRDDKPFNGTGGGTFVTQKDKYIETLAFYSWDSTAVGKTYTFDFSLKGNAYSQHGYINSDKYKNYLIDEKMERIRVDNPLQNSGLEGAWKMQSGTWGSSIIGEGKYKDVEGLKIFAYPRFAYAFFNTKTGQFVGAGGGTYSFDGTTLKEHIEYSTWGPVSNPDLNIGIELNGRSYSQTWDKNHETWSRVTN